MILYHGSTDIIDAPEIRLSNRTLDYGNGFYTTTSYSQAKAWVLRRIKEQRKNQGYINLFEFEEDALTRLNCLIFEKPTEQWVDFVMENRTRTGFTHDYDIVYGPVANDRVYAAFALYEGGILDKQTLIKELKTYKLVDQYLFHTKKALQTLTFKEAQKITV